jgi:hypothetical protein
VKTKHGLPRYVLAKRLADGGIAYYWNPKSKSLRKLPKARPLGRDLAKAVERATALNAKLDRAGRSHRGCYAHGHGERVRALLDIPSGFRSSIGANEKRT